MQSQLINNYNERVFVMIIWYFVTKNQKNHIKREKVVNSRKTLNMPSHLFFKTAGRIRMNLECLVLLNHYVLQLIPCYKTRN